MSGTENERKTSIGEAIENYQRARIELGQSEIDAQLALLRKGGHEATLALDSLLREFDRTIGSDYIWRMEITQKAYERLRRFGLVMGKATSDDSTTHYFLETRGTEGEIVTVGRQTGSLGFLLTRIIHVHGGRIGAPGGILTLGEVSGIETVKNPQAVNKAAIPQT